MEESVFILIIILFAIFIILKLLYDRYYPHIDIIKYPNKHTIILWYNKYYSNCDIKRKYIILF